MRYSHPLTEDQITEENYREVADELFTHQLAYNIGYFGQIMLGYFGDDDTDYLTTALDATKTLMDIGYDGSRQDLVDFLFTPRKIFEAADDRTILHIPLHSIDSAGGLCHPLERYSALLHDREEEDAD